MTYYLQGDGTKTIIDSVIHDGCELQGAPVEAESWIAAKKEFGFELTALQKQILDAA